MARHTSCLLYTSDIPSEIVAATIETRMFTESVHASEYIHLTNNSLESLNNLGFPMSMNILHILNFGLNFY